MDKVSDIKKKMNVSIDDQKTIEQMKQDYLSCPSAVKYVKKICIPDELIDSSISKIDDFVSDINYCSKCPGIDHCMKKNPTMIYYLIYKYGQVDCQLTPCKKAIEKMEYVGQFIYRDFDDSILNSDIKKLDNNAGRREVLTKYLNCIKKGDTSWIYVTGEVNSGRSYLMSTLLVDAAKRKIGPVAFLNTGLRFKNLADLARTDANKFANAMNELCNAKILVLDDFGNEYKNDFIRDGILFEIISKRNANRLVTIFTSDFKIDEIVTLYSKDKASAIRANQIGKIIKANCKKEINLGEMSVY